MYEDAPSTGSQAHRLKLRNSGSARQVDSRIQQDHSRPREINRSRELANKSSIDEHHSQMGNHDASMPAKSCVMLGGSQFSLVIQSLTSSSWILMHNRATETGSSASCVVLATAIS